MENDGPYAPPPKQDGLAQQPYYGWQYEQEPSVPEPQEQMPARFSQPLPSVQGLSALPPGQSQFRSLRSYASGPLATPPPSASVPLPVPAPQSAQTEPSAFQGQVLDMGASLGYGQGMEYQYVNAPQPSQPLPVLRQTRYQQLRAERLRRQQQGGSNQRGLRQTMSVPVAGPGPGMVAPETRTRSGDLSANDPGGASLSWDSLAHLVTPSGVLPVPWQEGLPDPALYPDAQPRLSTLPSEQRGTPPPDLLAQREALLPPTLQRGPSGLPLSTVSRALPVPPALVESLPTQPIEPGKRDKASVARISMILSGSFVLGRVLGLIRNALFAFLFGATATSDAYLQALLLPDLFFNIVAGGALGSAFLPVFARYLIGEKDERSAWQIASTVLNSVLVIMCILAMLAIMLAPWLVPIYSPGVPASELALIVSLTRLLLLQTIIMSGGVVIHAILSARQNFWLPALGTVLYNVGLIVGLLPGFFVILASRTAAHTTFAIYAATIGVTLGALLQVGIQIPGLLKERVRYSFTFDWKHPGVVQIARQMLPRLFNTAMLYLSLFVDRILILALIAGPLLTAQQGLVTQYYQALQLLLLPLGVFGMAVSTAAFPSLAEQVAQGNLERVRRIIDETLRSILFLSIPCGIGLIVLGVPLIQVLLQHGAFHLSDSTATSIPLAFFGLGLAGLTSVELLTRAFYAFRDNRTPVLISIGQFVLKMLLSLLLLRLVVGNPSWGLGMLAFATSLAGLIEAGALLWFLQRKIGRLALKPLAMFSGRVTLAALAMGAGVFLLRELLDLLLITTISPGLGILGSFFALFKLLCELALGILIYVWATRQFGIEAFWKQGPVRRLLERFKLSWI